MISMENYAVYLRVRACLSSALFSNSEYLVLENRHLKDPEDIEKFFKLAEYIRNGQLLRSDQYTCQLIWDAETLTLYSLSKYRHLRRLGY
jgi:hypothetical protein